jgi:hypothetical protein
VAIDVHFHSERAVSVSALSNKMNR